MRQLLTEMPKKVYYQLDYVNATVKEQNTKYNNACHTLYMLDFSSSPCYFDGKEVLRGLLEYDKSIRPFLLNICKFEVGFTVGRCKYAEMVYKEKDKVLFQVFHAIRRVLEAQRTLKDLSVITGRVFNNVGKHHVSFSVVLQPLAGIKGKYRELENPDIWSCVGIYNEQYITKVSYTPLLHKALANALKITDLTYDAYKGQDKPLFLEGITFAQEVELAPYLLEGDLCVTGEYAPEYENEYYAYLDSDPVKLKATTDLPQFSHFVLRGSANAYFIFGQEVDAPQKKLGRQPLVLTDSEIWYYTPSSTKRIKYRPSSFEVGSFFTVHGEEGMHNYLSQLQGYSGEFFKKDEIAVEKYEINVKAFSDTDNLLPSTVIINKNSQDNIYTQSGGKGYELAPKDLDKFLKLQHIKCIDDFQMVRKLDDLTLHLTKTLLCIIFDTTLKGYDTPYEVRFRRAVTEEEYAEACVKAAQIVTNFRI